MEESTMNKTNSGNTPTCDCLRESSNWNPAWEPFFELDPMWTEVFMSMAIHPITSGVLEPKVVELLAIAVDASCTHMYAPGTRRHIRKALELGATKEEVTAVL
jgi:alkylhydroperoxidase/carboxymuconolactone decarboxylase family protein YurZ